MFEQIRDILAKQLQVEAETITMETCISEDLGADSLDVVELLMTIEEEFGVTVPDDDVMTFKTVGDVVTYIENHQN